MQEDEVLDTTGLRCPKPILKAKMALRELSTSQVLHVISTDPASEADFRVFAKQTGHKLLESKAEDGCFHFWIQKQH